MQGQMTNVTQNVVSLSSGFLVQCETFFSGGVLSEFHYWLLYVHLFFHCKLRVQTNQKH